MVYDLSGNIKELFKKHNLWAKKSLGQHFLIDKNILNKIIEAADLTKKDTVLEIGSGLGVLTQELAKKAKEVITVEIDPEIAELLKENLKTLKNVKIVVGDILKIPNPNLKFKIVANIPYQITAPVLEKFLVPAPSTLRPDLMVLMLQKEVAEKICEKPPKMNRISVLAQTFANCQILFNVSRNCFWPKPEVESSVVLLKPIKPKAIGNPKLFLDLIRKGFSQKRKQLKNILDIKILEKAKIKPQKRAQTLTIKEWSKIYGIWEKFKSKSE